MGLQSVCFFPVCADARASRFSLLGGRAGRRVGGKHNRVRGVKKQKLGEEQVPFRDRPNPLVFFAGAAVGRRSVGAKYISTTEQFGRENKTETLKTTIQQGFSHETNQNYIRYMKLTFARHGRDTICFFFRHLGLFIFATRSEAKKVFFHTPENHGILNGRRLFDFVDFRKTQSRSHKLARTAAPETTRRRASCSCHSGHFRGRKKTKQKLRKNTCFYANAEAGQIPGPPSAKSKRLTKHSCLT